MSFSLIPAILLVATSIHVAITAPTPTTPKSQRLRGDYSMLFSICLHILKYACWLHAAIEVVLMTTSTLASRAPESAMAQKLCRNVAELLILPKGHIYSSPVRTVAGVSVVLGGTIRYLCYREMGRHFTYHVTVLKDHSLVTTGPYSIVRHPAYTGGDLVQVGLIFWHSAPGAWIRESGVYKMKEAWLVLLPASASVSLTLFIYMRRGAVEDVILRKEFGKQWDEWARRVPYRIIPGLY